MAAFIKKLFRARTRTQPESAPAKMPAVDEPSRQALVEEQQHQLESTLPQEQLETLALSGKTAEIRLKAAGQITDRNSLQRLQKNARGKDKAVYQVVRHKLQQLREDDARRQQREDAILAAIRQAQEHARSENTQYYEARLDTLLKQWKSLESSASAQQATDFLNAIHQCRERVRAFREEAEAERIQQARREERQHTLTLLEETLADLQHQADDYLPSHAALDALQKTQENRWLEATREARVEKAEQKAYESLMQSLRAYIAAVQRFNQQLPAIRAHLEQPVETPSVTADETLPDPTDLLKLVDWPDGYTAPASLAGLRRLAGVRKPAPAPAAPDQSAGKQALEQTLDALTATLEARQLKESKHFFKQAQQELRALDERHARGFQARFQLLNGQLRELQDWQGFATQPKQIHLCEQMEYLAAQHMEPEAKASKIKELQNEWRELGGSSDRELWQRFKQASDLAYEPCKAYFAAKSGLKQTNLETRRALCDQLAEFVAQTDWQTADWKAVEKIHRVARDEWKAAWPVEFRDNRPLQKRFDELLAAVETPLNEERDRNEALKADIVARAEALVDHEPLADAMNQAKQLQSEWKSIGITRHRQDRKLWQAFRSACDAIFARRDVARDEQIAQTRQADAQLAEVLSRTTALEADEAKTRRALINELEAIGQQPLSASMTEKLQAELHRLRSLEEKSELEATVRRWQGHIHARLEGQVASDALPADWSERADTHADLSARELVIRAEILTAQPSPEQDQSLRMEIQVQRLADGMSGTAQSGDLNDQLESLVAHWCLRAPADSMDEALASRLAGALAALVR